MSWETIGEPRLDLPTPAELPLHAPEAAWPHSGGGIAGNGRAAALLGYARTTRWVCELPKGPPVMRLLAINDRVLAIRAPDRRLNQQVELIDGDGQHLRTITGRIGDWAIDSRYSMLLGSTTEAELAAWSLDEPEHKPIFVFRRIAGRELDALRLIDDTLVIVTHQLKRLGGPPPDVLIDIVEVPHYDDVSRWRSLRSRTRVAERITEGINRVVLGFDPGGVILAKPDEVCWTDWTLRDRGRLDPGPSLLPLRSAPRGDGSTWLLTEHEDQTELWQLAVGRCERSVAVDPALVDACPLVGPDDGIVLASSQMIASIDANGARRWSFPRSGAATGLIDPQGVALYSDAGRLISTDPAGARATVWTAPAKVTRLGPLAATRERLWVGGGRLVFGLR